MKTLPRVRRARTAEMADFLELSSYKYTWSAEMCRFSKIEKSSKSLHPNLHVLVFTLYSTGQNSPGKMCPEGARARTKIQHWISNSWAPGSSKNQYELYFGLKLGTNVATGVHKSERRIVNQWQIPVGYYHRLTIPRSSMYFVFTI